MLLADSRSGRSRTRVRSESDAERCQWTAMGRLLATVMAGAVPLSPGDFQCTLRLAGRAQRLYAQTMRAAANSTRPAGSLRLEHVLNCTGCDRDPSSSEAMASVFMAGKVANLKPSRRRPRLGSTIRVPEDPSESVLSEVSESRPGRCRAPGRTSRRASARAPAVSWPRRWTRSAFGRC
jgi:hypothetical protein